MYAGDFWVCMLLGACPPQGLAGGMLSRGPVLLGQACFCTCVGFVAHVVALSLSWLVQSPQHTLKRARHIEQTCTPSSLPLKSSFAPAVGMGQPCVQCGASPCNGHGEAWTGSFAPLLAKNKCAVLHPCHPHFLAAPMYTSFDTSLLVTYPAYHHHRYLNRNWLVVATAGNTALALHFVQRPQNLNVLHWNTQGVARVDAEAGPELLQPAGQHPGPRDSVDWVRRLARAGAPSPPQ